MSEYNEESIFNMALAYLKRIDKLLYFCDISAINGDVLKWNNFLMSIFRELSIRMNEDELKEIEGDNCTIIDKNKNNKLDVNEVIILNNLTKEHATFRNVNMLLNNQTYMMRYRKQIMFLLHEIEIKLRKKMQEKGMLLPSKDDPRRAIVQN